MSPPHRPTPARTAVPHGRRQGFTACLLAGVLLASSAVPARANEIWFAPRGPESGGSPDWGQLFKDTPAWSSVASRLNVYSMTAGYVLQSADNDLLAMAANLARHHVALSLSSQSVAVTAADKCGGTEGFSPITESTAAADKLARLGIRLDNVTLDGPVWFGHFGTGPRECGFDIRQVAERVSQTIRAYMDRFPALTIGDVEGFPALTQQPGWADAYETFLASVATRVGRPIIFLQTDDNWRVPDIDKTIADMASFAHGHGLKFGVIYDGDDLDATDEAWVDSAIQHFTRLESLGGVVPDQPVFATWTRRPTNILPETDPAAFSHIIEVYQRTRVHLRAERGPDAVHGQLLDDHGQPVPHVGLTVRVIGSVPTQPPPEQTATGAVPAQARYALIGMRVNMECNCAGPNDLLVGDFAYTETGGAPGDTQTYSLPLEAVKHRGQPWDGVRVWPVETSHGLAARVVAAPGQRFGFTSDVFPVTPGATFTFRAPIGAVSGSGMFGTATVIWLDSNRQGLLRTNVVLTQDAAEVTTGSTDADGRFAIALPTAAALASRHLSVTAAMTPATRGTILELP
jgi:hypothetical protein